MKTTLSGNSNGTERKARDNLRKHGVAFDEAETVFADDRAILLDDPDHSAEEERFALLGMSARLRILTLAVDTGIAYQTLINLYLRECAGTGRRLTMEWRPSTRGAA